MALPRTAIVGYGAIAREMLRCLEAGGRAGAIAGVLDRPHRAAQQAGRIGAIPLVGTLEALLAWRPEIVVECAGHAAVADYGAAILASGADLLVSSVGALTDSALHRSLLAARGAGARLLIPSGAVAGLDGLLAARSAGLARVTYSSIKPPKAWKGTPAERLVALDNLARPAIFFEGTAREAAANYPQNANVGAAIAFASLGLDRTRVRLVADPAATGPLGIIEAEGEFGTFRFEALAYASPINPKTSLLTAHSLLAALETGWAFEPAA